MGIAATILGLMPTGTGVYAQIADYQAPGNLQASVDPGCIGFESAAVTLTPPDLGFGVQTCAVADDPDMAVGLYILMHLRARFDTLRGADETVHQAEQV